MRLLRRQKPTAFRLPPSTLILVLALPCLLLAGVPDTVNTEALPPPVHPGIAAGEAVTGCLIGLGFTYVGLVGGILAGWGIDPPKGDVIVLDSPGINILGSVGMVTGASLGSATGVWLVGDSFSQKGRFLSTWGWSALAAGSGVALGIVGTSLASAVGSNAAHTTMGITSLTIVLIGTPIAATWAYNRSRTPVQREADSRLSFGRVAMRPIAGPDRGLHTCLDLCLVNVGF
jgi:hypothetical protein